MRTRACLECLERTHELVPDVPLVPMTYAALLEAYGWERFATDAREHGATALIVAGAAAQRVEGRGHREDAVAQLFLEAVHHRQHDDQRRDAKRNAGHGSECDERHKTVAAGAAAVRRRTASTRSSHGFARRRSKVSRAWDSSGPASASGSVLDSAGALDPDEQLVASFVFGS